MKAFDNEWIVQSFEDHPSFFTKRMFGGLAVYLFGRQMMVLVEPTKTGRWQWHGVLICTDHAHHAAIIGEFPQLAPHNVLKKWLYIDSQHADFGAGAGTSGERHRQGRPEIRNSSAYPPA